MSKKIIVTGGNGRFAQELRKINSKFDFIFRNKKQLNILSLSSIKKSLRNLILTMFYTWQVYQMMSIHEKDINKRSLYSWNSKCC